jgi:hypothetical protein
VSVDQPQLRVDKASGQLGRFLNCAGDSVLGEFASVVER